jgi:hydroxyethylthiazole kinase
MGRKPASRVIQPEKLGRVLANVRRSRPVIHAITNWVTAGEVADVLSAVGGGPILAHARQEVEEVVSGADALVINLGTPDEQRVDSTILAGRRANLLGKPVVFDPVGVGASLFRKSAAERILREILLTAVRGNAAEIGYLAGMEGKLRGVDAARGPKDLTRAAGILSRLIKGVVMVSGAEDLIISQNQIARVYNGHRLMSQFSGTGCMLTALLGAFLAVEKDRFTATVGAAAFFGLAGEKAARQAKGPGSFKAALLDAVSSLSPEALAAGARIKT